MTSTDTAYDAALAYAAAQGAQDGLSAASWYFDGNTTADTYTAVLRGLDEGDPAVLGTLPHADLSGQWSDSLTVPAQWRTYLSKIGRAKLPAGHPGAAYQVALTDAQAAYDAAMAPVIAARGAAQGWADAAYARILTDARSPE